MELMREKKAYRFWFAILIPVIRLFYWVRPVGRENFPKGAAVICANHSNWIDPFLIAYALDGESLHMMAKAELFQNFLLKALLKAIGTFPVHREKADMKAVKTAMK